MLWFLGFCAIPPLIHLINRMRYRTVHWAAMSFLISAYRSSTRMARLRELLILLFRILAFAALALALSRPLMSGFSFFGFLSQSDHVLVLLDRSASMSAYNTGDKNRIKIGLQMLAKGLNDVGEKDNLTLIDSISLSACELETPSKLEKSVFSSSTATSSSIPMMLERAHEYIVSNKITSFQIWIVSDLQCGDWDENSPLWDELDAKFADTKLSSNFFLINPANLQRTKNISLKSVEFRRDIINPRNYEISFELNSETNNAGKLPITLRNENGQTSSTISIEGTSTLSKLLVSIPEGKKHGWTQIEIPSDAIDFDNKLFYAYGMPSAISVGIFCSNEDTRKAIIAATMTDNSETELSFSVSKMLAPDFNTSRLSEFSILFIEGLPPSDEAHKALDKFLKDGGTAFIFPPHEISSADLAICTGLSFKKMQTTEKEKLFSADDFIAKECPIPDDVAKLLPFAKFAKRAIVEGEANALLNFDDKLPLLSSASIGTGVAYIFSSPLSKQESNFTANPVFPLMIRGLIYDTIERKAQWHNIIAHQVGNNNDGDESIRLDDAILSRHFTEAGIYEYEGEIFAVNPPKSEYDDRHLNAEELSRLISGKIINTNIGELHKKSLFRELWREALFIAMLFLLIEQALSFSSFKNIERKEKIS